MAADFSAGDCRTEFELGYEICVLAILPITTDLITDAIEGW